MKNLTFFLAVQHHRLFHQMFLVSIPLSDINWTLTGWQRYQYVNVYRVDALPNQKVAISLSDEVPEG